MMSEDGMTEEEKELREEIKMLEDQRSEIECELDTAWRKLMALLHIERAKR